MNANDLTKLAERVEGPAGPCRESDEAVALAAGYGQRGQYFRAPGADPDLDPMGRDGWANAPAFTASLDAAMSLAPAGLLSVEGYAPGDASHKWAAYLPYEDAAHYGEGATFAAALTAAALRAHAAMQVPQ